MAAAGVVADVVIMVDNGGAPAIGRPVTVQVHITGVETPPGWAARRVLCSVEAWSALYRALKLSISESFILPMEILLKRKTRLCCLIALPPWKTIQFFDSVLR